MTNKEKLIKLLKTDKEVKEQMEKLEFGCKIDCKILNPNLDLYGYNQNEVIKRQIERNGVFFYETIDGLEVSEDEISKIHGLPLQERFIRMFCDKNNICKSTKDITFTKSNLVILENGEIHIESIHGSYHITTLDNTKDFDNQREEVYQKIFEALNQL